MIKFRCLELFGMIPDDLEIEFESLRMLSSEQTESVKNHRFSRLFQSRQAGFISDAEFRLAVNKGKLFDTILKEDNETSELKGESNV